MARVSSDWEQWRLLEAVVNRRNLHRTWSDDGQLTYVPKPGETRVFGSPGFSVQVWEGGESEGDCRLGSNRKHVNQTQ